MATLYGHQKRLIHHNPAKSLLCWDTGTGKTIGAIEWAQHDPNRHKVLIICPKALKANWNREVKSHGRRCDWLVKTKEEFRRDWKKLIPYHDTVIVDEAHYFAGMKSQMSKNLYNYLRSHSVPYRLFLTATPYMSTPWNIYTLARHLGHEWNYIDFRLEFFQEVHMGARVVPVVRKGIESKIASLVAEIGDVVRLDECADVPDQVFHVEQFDVTRAQQKMIDDIQEINPIVKYTRQHQIENGTLKSDGYTKDEIFSCDKNDRLIELAEENDKIAIVCRYNLQIEAIHRALKKLDKPIYIIQGKTKNRDELTREAERADKTIVLINASCSEGYELPSISKIIFASLSFSYKDYKQMLGRFLRINRLKKNAYIHLVTTDGVDKAVYDAIMRKQDFNIEIYAKTRTNTMYGETVPSLDT